MDFSSLYTHVCFKMHFATWADTGQTWLGSIWFMKQISNNWMTSLILTWLTHKWICLCNLCGSILKFATHKRSTSIDGLRTVCATNTSHLHIGWQMWCISHLSWNEHLAPSRNLYSLRHCDMINLRYTFHTATLVVPPAARVPALT